LSFELPEGEAGVGIQNVCKSSGTPERALAVAEVQQFGTPKVSLAGGGNAGVTFLLPNRYLPGVDAAARGQLHYGQLSMCALQFGCTTVQQT
jgi:hypothetical protein